MTHIRRYRLACIGAALLYLAVAAFLAFTLLTLGAALDAS